MNPTTARDRAIQIVGAGLEEAIGEFVEMRVDRFGGGWEADPSAAATAAVDTLLDHPEVLRALAGAPEGQPILVDRDGEEWHWIDGAYHSTSSPCTRAEVEQVWGPIIEKRAEEAA